jgi:hypothetical protein
LFRDPLVRQPLVKVNSTQTLSYLNIFCHVLSMFLSFFHLLKVKSDSYYCRISPINNMHAAITCCTANFQSDKFPSFSDVRKANGVSPRKQAKE